MLILHLIFSYDFEKGLKWLKLNELHSLTLIRKKTVSTNSSAA